MDHGDPLCGRTLLENVQKHPANAFAVPLVRDRDGELGTRIVSANIARFSDDHFAPSTNTSAKRARCVS